MKFTFSTFALILALFAENAFADEPARLRAHQQLLADLEVVAKKCEQLKLTKLARVTRGYAEARDPQRLYLFMPDRARSLKPAKNAPAIHSSWYNRLLRVRKAHAQRLFELAKKDVETNPTLAYQLLHEVLYHDADHEQARTILGYKQSGNRWTPPRKRIDSVRRGTISLPKVRFVRGKHWRINTAHFRIYTNHSREEGLRLANKLEDLYHVWKQVFFVFSNSKSRLRAAFVGQVRARPILRHRVILFKDKADYVRALKPIQPRIELSVGLYMQNQRTAYFFAGDPSAESTWLHEATHQLLHESGGRRRGEIGVRANFWAIEGVALYMESLCEHNGYWTVGGFDSDRLQYARYRVLNERYYLKLQQLVQLNRRTLQAHPNIRKLYSQAAGLSHFFMNGNGGNLRPKMMEYLLQIYDRADRKGTLPAVTKGALATLDTQYRNFLLVKDDAFKHLNPASHVRRLSLGHCPISDNGLTALSGYSKLNWLGLSTTRVSHQGLAAILPAMKEIETLDLENTATNDRTLAVVGKLGSLVDLDISGTAITNQGVAELRGLSKLKILYLSNTRIGDEALAHLYGLTGLEALDLTGVKVSAAAIQKLQQRLPKLKISGN